MPEGVKVEIKPAKGRPMLTWVSKQPLSRITAFPAQMVETLIPAGNPPAACGLDWSDWPASYPQGGLLFHGDNKEVMAHLLANGFRGKVKLIYIDPPFDSGADYVRKVTLRGVRGTAKIEGEEYTLGEQIQYTDIWANDSNLQFMYERLLLIKEMLAEDGFIVVHMNSGRVHYVKVMMDEIFGDSNFRNEILIKRIRKSYTEKSGIASLNEGADYLLLYSESPASRLFPPLKHAPKELRWHSFDAPNIRRNLTYELFGKWPPPGRCWMKSPDEAKKMIAQQDLRPNPSTGWPEYRIEASEHIVRDTLWDDVTGTAFTTDYPTEKKEMMLGLILGMASKPTDLVLDCFIGSGTTAAVAQKLGRRWIGCDINKGAIQTTCNRLQSIILKQGMEQTKGRRQPKLVVDGDENPDVPAPAQLTFAVYRVNDYDLQIQHNEAVNLACEHIGITRTKADAFFEGVLGKKLVKIAPFNHPLSPIDLEDLKRELAARPQEDRDVCVVCLGKEVAVDAWLEDYNRLRKQEDFPNKIEVIELRTDPRYGKFFIHQPATARVNINREDGKIKVVIADFISPTIIERLKQQAGPLLSPQIDDWRAMVDSVMIDPNYQGEVFNIALSDIPAKKSDLVAGSYELPAPEGETTVAVKITDMLGEEVILTQKV